ncbi:MAG: bifunctional [glutamine synthetase] adenylyltransferase/[glutamine synthetase]-adenylyl-L-tyrosine phosphorylase [Azospirillaceae bacterium]|nr:bifunctional [glutamine synthetase] adenylyltransferase/[glutamine synthetase]-adenylyl-L-tyrosine phosphorylase [Azospirillaceae bacterium]
MTAAPPPAASGPIFAELNPDRLPRPVDPAMADRWREDWRIAADAAVAAGLAWGTVARALALGTGNAAAGRRLLDAVMGNSPYLAGLMIREANFVVDIATTGFQAALDRVLDTLTHEQINQTDTDRLMTALRHAKRHAALTIALADIGGAWTLQQVTTALSRTADTALHLAATHLVRLAVAAGRIDVDDPADPLVGSGLIVLGMGKLGANELNYSSDIDLIVFYDDTVVRTRRPDDLTQTFVRLTRDLVRIIDERTRDGYVFRTDLRLRPDPGATPLAVSVSAAEAYYGSLGQNWERAAMIKARFVTGDASAGAAMLRFLRPFVWRRHLDFAAIQDIHAIKRQINAYRGYHAATVEGHDVKLGHGGIREIEFFVQTQQLIFGGREPGLRAPQTLAGLQALVAAGRVPADAAVELTAAYRFLRWVEHRLQMMEDQQTHRLPETPQGVAAFAGFLGYSDPERFRAELRAHLARVEDHYASLFEDAPPLADAGNLVFTGTDDDPATIATLRAMGFTNPAAIATTVRGWHHGRYRATRSTRAREILTELIPSLLRALAATPHPDDAFINFDSFLAGLPAGVQLLALVYNNPSLLNLVAEIMGTAPRLAAALSRRPGQFDAVLSPGFFDTLPSAGHLADDWARLRPLAGSLEETMDLCRRWTADQIFQAGAHILRHVTEADACGPFLSDVADLGLTILTDAVTEDFARQHGRFTGTRMAVLAMGRLGSREMTVRSDLDLIMVYDVPPELTQSDGPRPLSPGEYFIRLCQRLITAITAPTSEGRLYEVDMRLRPSGNAGPLAVSAAGFARYQADSAWTWEHMALTRARVATGPSSLRQRLEAIVATVLTRPRDPDRLLYDVAAMRRRIDKEFGHDDPWDFKYCQGGFIDIEFITQYLMLRHGHEHPSVIARDCRTALRHLAEAHLIAADDAATLIEGFGLWRRLQGFLRLTTEGRFDPETATPGLRLGLIRAAAGAAPTVAFDFGALQAKIAATAGRCHAIFDRLVAQPAAGLPPPGDPSPQP